jgi:hypothetical protein
LHRNVARSAVGQNHGKGLGFETGPSHYQEERDPKTHHNDYLKVIGSSCVMFANQGLGFWRDHIHHIAGQAESFLVHCVVKPFISD